MEREVEDFRDFFEWVALKEVLICVDILYDFHVRRQGREGGTPLEV